MFFVLSPSWVILFFVAFLLQFRIAGISADHYANTLNHKIKTAPELRCTAYSGVGEEAEVVRRD